MADDKNRYGELISKCWGDAAFKQRFLTDPKKVLAEFDIEVPAGLDVKVVENTGNMMYLTLPTKPNRDELSDNQLDAVSGGAGTLQPVTTVQPVAYTRFSTIIVKATSAGQNTCSGGKECVPW